MADVETQGHCSLFKSPVAWPVVTGCERLTSGCDNCPTYWEYKKNGWNYHPKIHYGELKVPSERSEPTGFMVAAGSDLFHEAVTEHFIKSVFEIMAENPNHHFEIVSKRIERMVAMSERGLQWPDNVVAATAVEEAKYKWRIDALRELKAKKKMISFGPLIGKVGEIDMEGIDVAGVVVATWGLNPRPAKQEWIDEIITQCVFQGVLLSDDAWLMEEEVRV